MKSLDKFDSQTDKSVEQSQKVNEVIQPDQHFSEVDEKEPYCITVSDTSSNNDVKPKTMTSEEDLKIKELHKIHGNKWTVIAKELPGRSRL